MDLNPSEDQQAIIDLATQIIADHTSPDRLRQLERSGSTHDAELWSALAGADLLGIALSEKAGGGGYGLTEAVLISEAVGRHVALVPYVEVIAAARFLAAAGDDLAREVPGGGIVVGALREGAEAVETVRPDTVAVASGGDWALTGEKRLVPGGDEVAAVLVPARAGDEVAVFVVHAEQITEQVESTTSAGQPVRTLHMDGTAGRRIALDDAPAALGRLRHELRILRCGHLAGVAAGAVALTAEHGKTREQFGAPIGTFQAVAHRLADAWLDTNLIQATARQAAWRTDNDLPATQAAASAALWACEGGQRVVHAAQHVHGGVGVDVDYPVHRYFRWAKDMELQLGGASASARDLGAAIAAEPLTIG